MKCKAAPTISFCPCGSGVAYETCCAPLHAGAQAVSAEALMRSRYSAYALGERAYLLASWHAQTRPTELSMEPQRRWLGLKVLRTWQDSETAAGVEFVARSRLGGGSAERLHERSRFIREADGRWYYLDGELLE